MDSVNTRIENAVANLCVNIPLLGRFNLCTGACPCPRLEQAYGLVFPANLVILFGTWKLRRYKRMA
jgi:hypothetical protein